VLIGESQSPQGFEVLNGSKGKLKLKHFKAGKNKHIVDLYRILKKEGAQKAPFLCGLCCVII
jgi:hypothetical protein